MSDLTAKLDELYDRHLGENSLVEWLDKAADRIRELEAEVTLLEAEVTRLRAAIFDDKDQSTEPD